MEDSLIFFIFFSLSFPCFASFPDIKKRNSQKTVRMSDFSKSGLCKDYLIMINGTSKEFQTYKLLIFSASRRIRVENQNNWFELVSDIKSESLISLVETLLEIIENRYRHRPRNNAVTTSYIQKFIKYLGLEFQVAKELVKAYVNIGNVHYWLSKAYEAGPLSKDLQEYCRKFIDQFYIPSPSSSLLITNKNKILA